METPYSSNEETLMSTICPAPGSCFSYFPSSFPGGQSPGSDMPRGHVVSLHPRTLQDPHRSWNLDQTADIRTILPLKTEAYHCSPQASRWPSLVGERPSCTAMQEASAADRPLRCGAATPTKQRIKWTRELHEQFVEAVDRLGGAMNATPKGILRLMRTNGLTIFHIKSHLQKYRALTPHCVQGRRGNRASHARKVQPVDIEECQLNSTEILGLQKHVERSLQEHLKLQAQRNLQMRIEAHTGYHKNMFSLPERSSELVLHRPAPEKDTFTHAMGFFSPALEGASYGEAHLNRDQQFESSCCARTYPDMIGFRRF